MSVYADYAKLSLAYDSTRPHTGPGVDLYLGLVYSLTGKRAEDVHVLDAGCGTGSHSLYLMGQGVKRITMVDASQGMREKSQAKLKPYIEQGKVEILQQVLPQLDFADGLFDVIMINQVLQHLTTHTDDGAFTNVRALFKEVFRVLKTDGVVLVTMVTPHQVREGFWYYKVFPRAMEAFAARVIDTDQFVAVLSDSGFQQNNALVLPLALVLHEECYFRKDGPLYDDWIHSNSATALASAEELKTARELVGRLKAEGKLDEFFAEADSMRTKVGQYTLFYGKKA